MSLLDDLNDRRNGGFLAAAAVLLISGMVLGLPAAIWGARWVERLAHVSASAHGGLVWQWLDRLWHPRSIVAGLALLVSIPIWFALGLAASLIFPRLGRACLGWAPGVHPRPEVQDPQLAPSNPLYYALEGMGIAMFCAPIVAMGAVILVCGLLGIASVLRVLAAIVHFIHQ
jgi:hypothetical protein